MAHFSTKDISSIEKLTGSDNYQTWAFAIRAVFELNKIDKCIDSDGQNCAETDSEKLTKARAIMVLCIHSSLYVHINTCVTALEIWNKLKDMFEDKGLSRKITLLRTLIMTNLQNCSSMDAYISEIISTANKLRNIDFNITEEWIGCFLLAGLTEDFRPFIMGIESSGVKITGDSIKTRLIEMGYAKHSSEQAFFGNSGNKTKSKCKTCGKGHKGKCWKRTQNQHQQQQPSTSNAKGEKSAFSAVFLSGSFSRHEFFIDSGASHHMTPYIEMLSNQRPSTIKSICAANNTKMADAMCW